MERFLDPKLNNIRFCLMRGAPDFYAVDRELYNQAYIYWRNFWNGVFRDNETADVVSASDFTRQEWVGMLIFEKKIVGMHLYSKFDLRLVACLEHPYWTSNFNSDFLNLLEQRGVYRAVSLEYLTVDREWRKKDLGLSMGSILLGLAVQVVKSLGGEVAIGPTRRDLKVTDLVRQFGGDALVSGITMHNTPCDLATIFMDQATPHPDPVVNHYVGYYWKNRVQVDLPEQNLQPLKSA